MRVDTIEIADGKLNGQIVYVTDIRSRSKKPFDKQIRFIKPTKVIICDNETTKKRIYYSLSHFRTLRKDGITPTSKVIPLVDNTGYRFPSSESVDVFTTLEEANEAYVIARDIISNQMYDELQEYERQYRSFKHETRSYK